MSIRILQLGLNVNSKSGGLFSSVMNFNEALVANGCMVDICSVNTSCAACDSVRNLPSSWGAIGRRYRLVKHADRSELERRLEASDLLFFHGMFSGAFDTLAQRARRRGIPYIVVPHGTLDPWVFTYRRWRKLLWWHVRGGRFVRNASAVVYATASERAKAQSRWSLVNGVVINWPVSNFAAIPVPESARSHWASLLGNRRIAVLAGRLQRVKRVLDTANAFLAAAPDDWKLCVVGPKEDPAIAARLESLCHRFPEKIAYYGMVDRSELRSLLSLASLSVLFSHKENFGYAAAEALACGVPVAVSESVGLCADIARARAGVVWDERSELAGFLRDLLAVPPAELAVMGERGRVFAGASLTFSAFSSGLEALCRKVVNAASEARITAGNAA